LRHFHGLIFDKFISWIESEELLVTIDRTLFT